MYELLNGETVGPPRSEISIVEVQKYLTEVAAAERRRSLTTFCKRGWSQLLPQAVIWSWHMDAICEHLAYVSLGEVRFLMINIPPRMSKTMLVSVLWPAWHWLHQPGEQFLFASVDDQLARDSAILSRRLIESPWYQDQWPGEIVLYDDENTAGMYRNKKGGYRMIASLQGRVTGVGGTILGLDDPHDAKKVESDQVHPVGADDLPTEPGYRETALLVDPLAVGLEDRRVHDDVRAVALVVDEEALLHANLIGGESHAGCVIHGLKHRFREGRDLPVDVLDQRRCGVQDRVAVGADR